MGRTERSERKVTEKEMSYKTKVGSRSQVGLAGHNKFEFYCRYK
jgi:hypothetical protein